MNRKHDHVRRQLEQFADALARDLDLLPDDELLREVTEDGAVPAEVASKVRDVLEAAIASHGKRRLAAARSGYDAVAGGTKAKIARLTQTKKLALVNRFVGDDHQLREKLTLAARNEEHSDADIDSFLEDLVELGVIDDDGNVL